MNTLYKPDAQSLYTPLEEAVAELHRRRANESLCRAVAEFRREHPAAFLNGEPCAMLAKALFSPDYELERFFSLSKAAGLPSLCLEFSTDRFVSFNRDKCRRGKMSFPWNTHNRVLRVIDIPRNEWKPFHQVPTVSDMGLVEFHHRLLKTVHPGLDGNLRDVSQWAEALSGKPLPYLHWLALAVTDGILFENFFADDSHERRFIEERVLPAFTRAIELFGVKPLIVRLFTPEEENTPICWHYPGELYAFACSLLNGGKSKQNSTLKAQNTTESRNAVFPHHGVYTRLDVSKIHGIGVLAIHDIPKGTKIFSDDESKVVWIDKPKLEKLGLDEATTKFYRDFCIIKDGKYGCPANFNELTISWYLNEPEEEIESNVRSDENYVFFAKRDIRKGEELTIDYRTFSEEREYLR